MYLHIGKNVCVNQKKIIGIFHLESIEKTKEYQNLIQRMKKDMIYVSEGNEKSFILVEEKENIKGYFTNILSTTLEKREMMF